MGGIDSVVLELASRHKAGTVAAKAGQCSYGNGISGRSHRLSGFDIIEACKSFEEDQIAARIGSQADLGFLDSVLAEFGPPDVVLPQRESRRR